MVRRGIYRSETSCPPQSKQQRVGGEADKQVTPPYHSSSLHVDSAHNSNPTKSVFTTSLNSMRGSVGHDLRNSTGDLLYASKKRPRNVASTNCPIWYTRPQRDYYHIIHRPKYQVSKRLSHMRRKSNGRSLPWWNKLQTPKLLISAYRAKAASTMPKRPAPEAPILTLVAALAVGAAPVEEPETELPVLLGPLEEAAIDR